MTAIVQAIRGWWGRERLRQRVSVLEAALKTARKMSESIQRTNLEVIESNRQLAATVSRLEEDNKTLVEACDKWARSAETIDRNAKCPGCGHRKGHLTHVVKGAGLDPDIRVVNNCEECGLAFISKAPVAGPIVGQLYQAAQDLLGERTGR